MDFLCVFANIKVFYQLRYHVVYGRLDHMCSRKQNVKNCCFAFGCFCSLKDKGNAEPTKVSPAVPVAVARRGTTEEFDTPAICLAPSLSCPAMQSLLSGLAVPTDLGSFLQIILAIGILRSATVAITVAIHHIQFLLLPFS